jgi:hypothetical protein
MYYDQLINLGNDIQKEEFVDFLKLGKTIAPKVTNVVKKSAPKVTNVAKKSAPKVTNVAKKSAPKVTNLAKKGTGAIGTGAAYAVKNPKKVAAGTAALGTAAYAAADTGVLGEDAKAIADNIEDKVGDVAKDTVNVVKKTANAAGDLVGDALWSIFKPIFFYVLVFFAIFCGLYFPFCIYTKQYERALISLIVGGGSVTGAILY